MAAKNALAIFLKLPIPGQVKTRLQPDFTPEQSAQIYKAFLLDLLNEFSEASGFDTWLVPMRENFTQGIMPEIDRFPRRFFQSDGNLGRRMQNCFSELFNKGYKKAAIIGSDLPTLTQFDINEAFTELDSVDCVLGPTEDGGYYLIGMNKLLKPLFEDIAWSTEEVLGSTLRNAKSLGISLVQLDQKYDIDSINEVNKLYSELSQFNQEFLFSMHTFKQLRSYFK